LIRELNRITKAKRHSATFQMLLALVVFIASAYFI
jgi:hypothetical protein